MEGLVKLAKIILDKFTHFRKSFECEVQPTCKIRYHRKLMTCVSAYLYLGLEKSRLVKRTFELQLLR